MDSIKITVCTGNRNDDDDDHPWTWKTNSGWIIRCDKDKEAAVREALKKGEEMLRRDMGIA